MKNEARRLELGFGKGKGKEREMSKADTEQLHNVVPAESDSGGAGVDAECCLSACLNHPRDLHERGATGRRNGHVPGEGTV